MLVQAASGLERLMVGNRNNALLKDSTVAQISAYMYYNAQVISKLTTNKAFQSKFSSVIFAQIDKDFGEYIDALARTRPKSLHHVYEWKKVGNKTARLFKLNLLSQEGLSFKVGYQFTPSKSFVPASKYSRRRHVFANKAEIMENGIPVTIVPKKSSVLAFEQDGETIFTKGPINVDNPGGPAVQNGFQNTVNLFFSRYFTQAFLRTSGLYDYFNNPKVYKKNLQKGRTSGKAAGISTGYAWIVNAKVNK